MKSLNRNGVSFYQFENLARLPGIDHGIFARTCGYSKGPYSSLNVSYGIGDEKTAVANNRARIADTLAAGTMTYLDQVHGCEIALIDQHQNSGKTSVDGRPIRADAAVTNLTDHYLVIQVADCQPVLMYEPTRRVVANVHSGWRGSIGNIIGRTVDAMVRHFRCRPDRIQAAIGPSLGPCCAEFINYKTEIPEKFWTYRATNNHFDFWAISSDQLIDAGVPKKNIASSQACTRCRTDDFYSYRAEKNTGRFAAVIGMTNVE